MTKSELVAKIAGETGLTKADSERALNAFIGTVKKTLKKNDTVSLVGFGTFYVSKRKARKGRNPRTGDAIKIPAAKLPKFRAGKGLKDALGKR